MSEYLFVYGTLKRNHHNYPLLVNSKASFINEVVTEKKYTLLNLGHFPGVTLEERYPIKGELYSIPDLKSIDTLEGYPNFYDRIRINVITKGGLFKFKDVWMYVLNPLYNVISRKIDYNIIDTGEWAN